MGPLLLLCKPSTALSLPPPPVQPSPPRVATAATAAVAPPVLRTSSARRKLVSAVLSGALSLGLLFLPPSITAESPLVGTTKSGPSLEYCREEEAKEDDGVDAVPERVTNERIVEEAWDIVNESFLGTGRRRCLPEAWQRKKEDILSTSIPTRSKARELIRRMLVGLGDPYTRFLSPDEVIRSPFALVNFVVNVCLWIWRLLLGWRSLTLLVSLHFIIF